MFQSLCVPRSWDALAAEAEAQPAAVAQAVVAAAPQLPPAPGQGQGSRKRQSGAKIQKDRSGWRVGSPFRPS